MQEIKGKFRSLIFDGKNGYKIGLFKVKETSIDLEDLINKTITFSGYFSSLSAEETYLMKGEYINHAKYGYQFQVNAYEKVDPEGKDAIVEFLSSSLIKGCGEKTALKIVNTLGEEAIEKIKADINNLLLVPGITQKMADKIYRSLIEYGESDQILIDLKDIGFSIKESLKLFELYQSFIINMAEDNIYQLSDVIDFNKLDSIFMKNHDLLDPKRINACIIESLKRLSYSLGDAYSTKEEIFLTLKKEFNINIDSEELLGNINALDGQGIIIDHSRYYLKNNYEMEEYIANSLCNINLQLNKKINHFDILIDQIQNEIKVTYDDDQKEAIKKSLENNVSIITGGPGTGKTTIINGLVKIIRLINDWYKPEDLNKIALLAPTGRASKKMAESTRASASTIHRYLKWNKDDDTFGYNEDNPHQPRVVIVDETSMVDTYLMFNLLKGIEHQVKIIFVGDENQLPSVGFGLILNDLINSKKFNHVALNKIYRQSNKSYIPYLAKEIKETLLSDEFFDDKDDFKFIEANNHQIKDTIKQICELSIKKALSEEDIQVLVPMYKGENGIDNLNILLQNIFNPSNELKREIAIGDVIYRENDKVIQLINDPDNNVYNGDVGYIKKINDDQKKLIEVNYDGNIVIYRRDNLNAINHAYAISIHKSQGSEFNHVIMPITINYSRMLYNKLIYTGVTRAKKSLMIIGNYDSLEKGVLNNYSETRKTTLKEKIIDFK